MSRRRGRSSASGAMNTLKSGILEAAILPSRQLHGFELFVGPAQERPNALDINEMLSRRVLAPKRVRAFLAPGGVHSEVLAAVFSALELLLRNENLAQLLTGEGANDLVLKLTLCLLGNHLREIKYPARWRLSDIYVPPDSRLRCVEHEIDCVVECEEKPCHGYVSDWKGITSSK